MLLKTHADKAQDEPGASSTPESLHMWDESFAIWDYLIGKLNLAGIVNLLWDYIFGWLSFSPAYKLWRSVLPRHSLQLRGRRHGLGTWGGFEQFFSRLRGFRVVQSSEIVNQSS